MAEEETTEPTKKPSDSAFRQQRLPAWQPVLTAGTVLPTFFVIGIAFIPIGIGMLYFSEQVSEASYDYTKCKSPSDVECFSMNITSENHNTTKCECEVPIDVDEDWEAPVFLYYELTNFYQNHRRYVKSRDDNQLLGDLDSHSGDCDPFRQNDEGKYYAPCGAIANSLFSDVIVNLKFVPEPGGAQEDYTKKLIKTGIAWESDKLYKFKNPSNTSNTEQLKSELQRKKLAKPKDWYVNLWELDDEFGNNGFANEDLIVWMRTAALPNFRKLYRKIDVDTLKKVNSLPAKRIITDNHTSDYFNARSNCQISKLDQLARTITPAITSTLARTVK